MVKVRSLRGKDIMIMYVISIDMTGLGGLLRFLGRPAVVHPPWVEQTPGLQRTSAFGKEPRAW
jgi:hypothetical protein